MTEVAKLVTEITADVSKFTAGINKAKGDANSLTATIKAGSVLAIAAFTAIAGSVVLVSKEIFTTAEKVGQLYDNTRKIGVSVAAFQELSIAAREAGVSTDSLQTLLGNMNKRLGDAALNGGKTADALRALGLTFKDLSGLTTDQKFALIAEKLRNIKDLQLETAIASDIFGKSAKDGIGLFNSNINESIARVREFGITLTESQAAGLDKLSETKDLAGSVWDGFKTNVASNVAPAFQELLDRLLGGIKAMGGLKDAAKNTADFIIDAMQRMETAVNNAILAMKVAKSLYTDVLAPATSALLTPLKGIALAVDDAGSRFVNLFKDINRGLSSILPSQLSDQYLSGSNKAKPDTSPAMGAGVLASSALDPMMGLFKEKEKAQTDAATMAMAAYTLKTNEAAAAMKALKEQAMKAAQVLDSFKAIKTALEAPSKAQASGIIESATGSQLRDTIEKNRSPIASLQSQLEDPQDLLSSDAFDALDDQLTSLTQQTGYAQQKLIDLGANLSPVTKEFQDLYDKLVQARNKDNFKPGEARKGLDDLQKDIDRSKERGENTSGLVTALNELKSFLAQKPKDMKVNVNVQVSSSENFVTTITTSQDFKEAVDAEFDAKTAAAARGNTP